MDETVDGEVAGGAILETPEAHADRDDAPVAYVFDGWGMVPFELQARA